MLNHKNKDLWTKEGEMNLYVTGAFCVLYALSANGVFKLKAS